jgi:hypothetical protein
LGAGAAKGGINGVSAGFAGAGLGDFTLGCVGVGAAGTATARGVGLEAVDAGRSGARCVGTTGGASGATDVGAAALASGADPSETTGGAASAATVDAAPADATVGKLDATESPVLPVCFTASGAKCAGAAARLGSLETLACRSAAK